MGDKWRLSSWNCCSSYSYRASSRLFYWLDNVFHQVVLLQNAAGCNEWRSHINVMVHFSVESDNQMVQQWQLDLMTNVSVSYPDTDLDETELLPEYLDWASTIVTGSGFGFSPFSCWSTQFQVDDADWQYNTLRRNDRTSCFIMQPGWFRFKSFQHFYLFPLPEKQQTFLVCFGIFSCFHLTLWSSFCWCKQPMNKADKVIHPGQRSVV